MENQEKNDAALEELHAEQRKVAEAFFWQWISDQDSESAITAIVDLIRCGAKLEKVVQRLALNVEE